MIVKFNAKKEYVPTTEKYQIYQRAMSRLVEHGIENLQGISGIQKFVHITVKMVANMARYAEDTDNILLKMNPMKRFEYLDSIVQTIGLLTPRQLMQVFPVTKTYDGDKYEMKDYFYTMNEASKIGMDNQIGYDKSFSFLYDYQNHDISRFLVETITALNLVNMYRGGRDALEVIFSGELLDQENKQKLPEYIKVVK